MSEDSKSLSAQYDKKLFGNKFEGFQDEGEEIEYEKQVESKPLDITEETLKPISHESYLIKLHRPKVENHGQSSYLELTSETYTKNSEKEKLILCYAENFRQKYDTTHQGRKPLLLACNNEFGIQVKYFFN